MANRFDEVAKLLASGVSRRQALKVLGGSIFGGIFAGKALQGADAATYTPTTYNRHQLMTGCKSHCSAATGSSTSDAYHDCYDDCLTCPGTHRSNGTPANPGGPDNMCADLDDDGKTYHRAACCSGGTTCDPNRNYCANYLNNGTVCPAPQQVCGSGANQQCCPRSSTCMVVSGTPTCVMRCSTVVCGTGAAAKCCPSGTHCGFVSGSPTPQCLPGASVGGSVARPRAGH